MNYDRSALVDCRLHVLAGPASGFGDYSRGGEAFNEALAAYWAELEAALERRFGATLVSSRATDFDARVLLMLFGSTAHSYLAIRTPWSDYLEVGLLVQKLDGAGPAGTRVRAASDRIEEAAKTSRAAHREMLDTLAGHVLGDRADTVVTSADLLADGFDDTRRPDPADFPAYED
ncbi:hypothetical protein [Streptomyces sp. NPDC021020]|uniref:hypothetical protein n=1 Tax=Streptomyces sp. NPDC021020 TaxID=3365109 RepID=UPI0037BD2457